MTLNDATLKFLKTHAQEHLFLSNLYTALIEQNLEVYCFLHRIEEMPLLCVLIKRETYPLEELVGNTLFGYEQVIQELSTCFVLGICDVEFFERVRDDDSEVNREAALLNVMR